MTDLARVGDRPLRVLQGTYEIAGQGMVLARGLRALGCDARALAYRVDWDGRRPDLVVELDRLRNPIVRGAAMAATFARWAPYFDVFHFHFGTSFLPRQIDLPLLRALGKRIVFHFHGCEVRSRAHMLGAHALSTCTECAPFCRPDHQRWLLGRAERYADHVFYSTPDLAESVPGGTHLPLAIEPREWEAAADARARAGFAERDGIRGPVVVAHAPTNRLIKGTRHVIAAVEALRSEFPRLELELIDRRPWSDMPAALSGCDILVDQVFMGWYGLLAIEGLAEGRAVVSYLREDFRAAHAPVPIVSATAATLAEALRGLIRDPSRRARLGAESRAYVRAQHDAVAVARVLLPFYRPERAAAESR